MGMWTEIQDEVFGELFETAYENDFDIVIIFKNDSELRIEGGIDDYDGDIDWGEVKEIRIIRFDRDQQGDPDVS